MRTSTFLDLKSFRLFVFWDYLKSWAFKSNPKSISYLKNVLLKLWKHHFQNSLSGGQNSVQRSLQPYRAQNFLEMCLGNMCSSGLNYLNYFVCAVVKCIHLFHVFSFEEAILYSNVACMF